MKVYKNKGIIYANAILDLLADRDVKNIDRVSVEPFYNCREQGYKLTFLKDFEAQKTIWVYAHRNSDRPTITWKDGYSMDNMFNEESWAERTISFDNIEDAVNKIEELLNQ